eukprot:CAMPEP_0170224536 /NCGR_PEP_ID=MMETSP0116_2-20130129/11970_1 /TAXON_ID=400756 /ORGANISM="Durinskia baltica, Strain CSIRO CS-38" /LENGTH=111 /DNA_ID=CAMNT_0010475243 /DNA_START=64 /DNA_END=396 /DNA_ORIENTATION=+
MLSTKIGTLLLVGLAAPICSVADSGACPKAECEKCGSVPDGDDTGLLQLAHPNYQQCGRAGDFCGNGGFVSLSCCGQLECKQVRGGSRMTCEKPEHPQEQCRREGDRCGRR